MRIGIRHRILGAVLVLAGAAWWLDSGGATRPKMAAARASENAVAPTQRWQDLTQRVEELRGEDYLSVAPQIDRLRRDLFTPTAILAALQQPAEEPEAEEVEVAATAEPPFAERFRLQAVLLGRLPMAVINDEVVPLHSDVAGYKLVELRRDAAVFQKLDEDERVELRLTPGPQITTAAQPRRP